jgi:hypothetical protein
MRLDSIFKWIGRNVSTHPYLIIVSSLAAMIIILSGLMFIEFDVKLFLIE